MIARGTIDHRLDNTQNELQSVMPLNFELDLCTIFDL